MKALFLSFRMAGPCLGLLTHYRTPPVVCGFASLHACTCFGMCCACGSCGCLQCHSVFGAAELHACDRVQGCATSGFKQRI
jgi:hypothetical protein